jgi:hypothetical protein
MSRIRDTEPVLERVFAALATNDRRIERMNQAAPGFFRMLQNQQFETNMMHLARVTDKPNDRQIRAFDGC